MAKKTNKNPQPSTQSNTNDKKKDDVLSNENNFDALVLKLKLHFNSLVSSSTPLFTTDCDDLFSVFLNNIAEDRRQHYKCNACRQFINNFGGLVKILDDGQTVPIMWDKNLAAECTELSNVLCCLRDKVSDSNVTSIFLSSDKNFGVERNKTKDGIEWTHFHIINPNIFKNKLHTPHQISAEKQEDFKILCRSLKEFSQNVAETAITLLKNDILSRSEKILGITEWFLTLHKKLDSIKNPIHKQNIIWAAVASAPMGFCHIRNSMIGTLLEDISCGNFSLDEIKQRFSEKINPVNYQRPKAAPAAGNIAAAEKLIEKLGIQKSLLRRFAKLEEIQTVWKPVAQNPKNKDAKEGVFAHITPKNTIKKINNPSALLKDVSKTPISVTWEKFYKTILPAAVKIEFQVPSTKYAYGAIVTAEHPNAPPILQWDIENETDGLRNPFSTYVYETGSFPHEWNLKSDTFINVTAITFNPWMWFSEFTHHGKGVMFILENCKDVNYISGGGFFPESLKSELHQIRSTLESYIKMHKISGLDEASVCGLRFEEKSSNKKPENHIFKATDKDGVQMLYKLDRWD